VVIERGAISVTVQPADVNIAEGAVKVNAPVSVAPAQTTISKGAFQVELEAHLPGIRRGPVERTVTERDNNGLIVKTVERELDK
jgi:hypothetical protein